ncbi:hypothetical protein VpaJT1_24 [Vibrio phage VpaJT_1]|nr:hypothetical protein VpaJT1_24 [Vibrio phage VpaJT_1]
MIKVMIAEQENSSLFFIMDGVFNLPRHCQRVAVVSTTEERLRQVQNSVRENQLPEDSDVKLMRGTPVPFERMIDLFRYGLVSPRAQFVKRVLDKYTLPEPSKKKAKIPTKLLYDMYVTEGGEQVSRIEFGKILRNELGLHVKQTTYNGKITACVLYRSLRED